MAVYEVLLSKATRKQLGSLPAFIHNKIIEDIAGLATALHPAGCKKLKGYKNSFRIRVGDLQNLVIDPGNKQTCLNKLSYQF